jgi:hypothetical protein
LRIGRHGPRRPGERLRGNFRALGATHDVLAPLSRIDVPLRARLATGKALGAIGYFGHCFGDHMHFETRRGADASAGATDPTA